MTKQMSVVNLETAPTGMYRLASAYVDCLSEMGGLYDVETDVAANLVEERCGPLRARLQKMVDTVAGTLNDLPTDGPVVVFIRSLGLPAIIRKGRLRFL